MKQFKKGQSPAFHDLSADFSTLSCRRSLLHARWVWSSPVFDISTSRTTSERSFMIHWLVDKRTSAVHTQGVCSRLLCIFLQIEAESQWGPAFLSHIHVLICSLFYKFWCFLHNRVSDAHLFSRHVSWISKIWILLSSFFGGTSTGRIFDWKLYSARSTKILHPLLLVRLIAVLTATRFKQCYFKKGISFDHHILKSTWMIT